MSQQEKPQPQQLRVNIEVPADLEATYANLAVIRHSPSEVVIDFVRQMPEQARAKVYARIVMTPVNAKLLLRALQQNLSNYEEKFGEIRTQAEGFQDEKPIGFAR
ncbi:MAG: DUF3467 domain-containing protein [Chloroflexia bacterium]|nr:DUF3467 domain-containing protein [Chloroflexia bacterium]